MKFNLEQAFSGYVRGYRRMTVEADSEEEAIAQFEEHLAELDITRDDTSSDEVEAEEVVRYVRAKKAKKVEEVKPVPNKYASKIRSMIKRAGD